MQPVRARSRAGGETAIRREAARNPATPTATLVALAESHNPYVREAAARNPSTPAPMLAVLAADRDIAPRRRAAQNPSTQAATLLRLGTDPAHEVRDIAVAKLKARR